MFKCKKCGYEANITSTSPITCKCGYREGIDTAPISLKTKTKTFAQAVVRHVRNGMKRVDAETETKRRTICEGCPFSTGTNCKLCGCRIVGKINKLQWASESCPEGYWLAENNS